MKSEQYQNLKTRNAELEKELAHKNHDLEIEAALERVRTVAMGMRKPQDLLDICEAMFKALQTLGFDEIRNAMINILDDEHGSFLNYDYSDTAGATITRFMYDSHPFMTYQVEVTRADSDAFIEFAFEGQELEDFKAFKVENGEEPDPRLDKASALCYYFYSIGIGSVGVSTFSSLPEEKREVLKRFRNVFDLAYRRYADIEQAEVQAREARIEVALERVRSRSMGMQKSEELQEVIQIVYEQLVHLDIAVEHTGFIMDYRERNDMHIWLADKHEVPSEITIPYFDSPHWNSFIEAKEKGMNFFANRLTFEEKNKFYRELFEFFSGVPVADKTKKYYFGCPGLAISTVLLENVGLYIENFSGTPYTDKENATLMRFGKVFQQTYTRFCDLQKAEAQARESQIQLALERVRARTMAMQKSDELAETVFILFQQFQQLGENPDQATIGIINEEEQVIEYWVTMHGSQSNRVYKFSIDEPNVTQKIYQGWKGQKKSIVIDLSGTVLKDFTTYRAKMGGAHAKKGEKRRIINVAFFSKGLINVQSAEERSEESIRLLERFAAVFDSTYTRFLDLKQAEAQAREAQIQLGLERVRARAMAMQTSTELADLVATVLGELKKLDFALSWCLVTLVDYEAWACRVWMANTNVDQLPESYYLPFIDLPFQKAIMQAWKERKSKWVYELKGAEKKATDEYMFTKTDYRKLPEAAQTGIISLNPAFFSFSFSNFGGLQTGGPQPLSDANLDILSRFGKVFDLTYTRFNDLQKAEAQVREARIEASLERVRSKTMAMHNSQDVGDTVAAMFDELVKLGVKTNSRLGILIVDDTQHMEVWTASSAADGKVSMLIGRLNMMTHPLLQGLHAAWKQKGSQFSYHMAGEDMKNYYREINNSAEYSTQFNLSTLPPSQEHNSFLFAEGAIFVFSLEQLPAEIARIFKRFAGVFGQTYRRYLDLQKAEAQAKEAKVEAGLERVRSRTLAMQSSEELAETAAVLFKQLIGLGIEPNRLYIGIVQDDTNGDIELWATDEDGSKVNRRFTGNINRNSSVKKMYDGWIAQKGFITIDMRGKELKDYFHYLADELKVPFKLGLSQKRRVQSIAYFSKGFIGIASPDEQPQETIKLLERFAGVFNLTFVRFHDLKLAEAHAIQAEKDLVLLQTAKKRAEEALNELRTTQTQLIQSEKMASLGELTAGIAHEIQNPLNFVNNFSEVNREMIDELEEELRAGNIEDALAIAADIRQNEEKISHHGKRADGIVKGMLQHSRTGGGEKQPTNMNVLADEFLRLSYHGLRAKDKLFNAELVTHFDPNLPDISVIPQDMGRVMLNLFNNAFYAVNQKKKTADANYRPTVTITTFAPPLGGWGATVTDNGIGMPEHVKAKIMQPFFTTKPTGEGTGLGLSLTYDMIVKGHGGTIEVESREGEGSEFKIILSDK